MEVASGWQTSAFGGSGPSSPLVELPKHFHGRNVLILEWDDRVGGLAKPVN